MHFFLYLKLLQGLRKFWSSLNILLLKGFFNVWPFKWLPVVALRGWCIKALLQPPRSTSRNTIKYKTRSPSQELSLQTCFWTASLSCTSGFFFFCYVDLKKNKKLVFSVSKTRSELSLAFLSFLFCPGEQGTAGWSGPNGAAPGSLQLEWLQSAGQRGKKILRSALKRGNEGFGDKAGVLDATDVFPKEVDFLGSPILPWGLRTSNLLQILDGKEVVWMLMWNPSMSVYIILLSSSRCHSEPLYPTREKGRRGCCRLLAFAM